MLKARAAARWVAFLSLIAACQPRTDDIPCHSSADCPSNMHCELPEGATAGLCHPGAPDMVRAPDAAAEAPTAVDARIDVTLDEHAIDASPVDMMRVDAAKADHVPAPDTMSPIAAPRPIFPPSTSTVSSQQPLLKWQLARGTDGARVQICYDRACSRPETQFDVSGSSGAPSSPLLPGATFWRLYGRSSGVVGISASPTWQFYVRTRSAPVNTASGTTLDVNGDGYADVAVGAPNTSSVYVYYGSPAGVPTSPSVTLLNPRVTDFGTSVSSAGDVNGDGVGDLLIVGGGGAFVFLGGEFGVSTTPSVMLTGPSGFSVGAGVGDFNGDGYGDIALGTPNANAVYLFVGGPTGATTTPFVVLTGPPCSYFGNIIGPAGDINGDGLADLITGSDLSTAYVYLGTSAGSPRVITLTGMYDFGQTVAGSGDVNGDGYSDVLVGNPYPANSTVDLYWGSASGIGGNVTINHPASGGTGNFGAPLANEEDVNGDGFDDVIVGSPGASSVYVYVSTGASGVSTTPSWTLTESDASFARTVASAGDLNGDGLADILAADRSSNLVSVFLAAHSGGFGGPVLLTGPPSSAFGSAVAIREVMPHAGLLVYGQDELSTHWRP